MNLFAFVDVGVGVGVGGTPAARYARSLVHDLVVVVTHELAHFLEPGAGHGPLWRDTHMRMVIEVMGRLEG